MSNAVAFKQSSLFFFLLVFVWRVFCGVFLYIVPLFLLINTAYKSDDVFFYCLMIMNHRGARVF